MLWILLVGYWVIKCLSALKNRIRVCHHAKKPGRRKPGKPDSDKPGSGHRYPPKPAWVSDEVLKMKALMPDSGCRAIASAFNRRFQKVKGETVSKSYVHQLLRRHAYEIQILRKSLKKRSPRPVPKNLIWGMDLTGKVDTNRRTHTILGLLDHGSRGALVISAIRDKASLTLLEYLIRGIRQYGKPAILRTDNEPVFTSRLFFFGLWLLGIRHQTIDRGCPWQNGRVERLFGTLKGKLDQWEVDDREQLNRALGEFRFWYNHVRPHQNLEGRTPAEVWQGKDVYARGHKAEYYYSAWDGLLTGYYLPT